MHKTILNFLLLLCLAFPTLVCYIVAKDGDRMKKLSRTSELLWLFGILFVALGVAICSKADLGVSMIAAPAFVVHGAVSRTFPNISVGVVEYAIQGILLVILCLVIHRFHWRYLLAFGVAVLYGYALNLFLWILGGIQPKSTAERWIMLLIGDAVTAFGVACFFRTYMPLQVFELFVAEIADRFHLPISKVKSVFDFLLLAISVGLAFLLFPDAGAFPWSTIGQTSFHSIGLGTLVTTAINSPLINMMGKLIDSVFDPSPRFRKLKSILNAK